MSVAERKQALTDAGFTADVADTIILHNTDSKDASGITDDPASTDEGALKAFWVGLSAELRDSPDIITEGEKQNKPFPTTDHKYSNRNKPNVNNPIAGAEWSEIARLLGADTSDLLRELEEINGTDAYDTEAQSIGRIEKKVFLQLPIGYHHKGAMVTTRLQFNYNSWEFAQIFALNLKVAPESCNKVIFAQIRTLAVAMGWGDGKFETTFVAPMQATEVAKLLNENKGQLQRSHSDVKRIAYLHPFIAEQVFRKLSHHFLSTDAVTYTDAYRALYTACLIAALMNLMPAEVMFHTCLHWATPGQAYKTLQRLAVEGAKKLPSAIVIRLNAAPAGNAIVTTTAAVFKSMMASGIYDALKVSSGMNLDLILKISDTIKQSPPKYHKFPFAYGVEGPNEVETKALETARELASQIAPITQGYLDAMFMDADLGKAKALQKHAAGNPIRRRMAQRYFKQLSKPDSVSMKDLFKTDIKLKIDA